MGSHCTYLWNSIFQKKGVPTLFFLADFGPKTPFFRRFLAFFVQKCPKIAENAPENCQSYLYRALLKNVPHNTEASLSKVAFLGICRDLPKFDRENMGKWPPKTEFPHVSGDLPLPYGKHGEKNKFPLGLFEPVSRLRFFFDFFKCPFSHVFRPLGKLSRIQWDSRPSRTCFPACFGVPSAIQWAGWQFPLFPISKWSQAPP